MFDPPGTHVPRFADTCCHRFLASFAARFHIPGERAVSLPLVPPPQIPPAGGWPPGGSGGRRASSADDLDAAAAAF